MKLPLKPIRTGWPWPLCQLSIMREDPRLLADDISTLTADRISAIVSVLKFGAIFKTTRSERHNISDRYLADVYRSARPTILDVGASDGSTALDLIAALEAGFRRYFVTDLNISVVCAEGRRGVLFFSDREGRCMLRASRRWLTYADTDGSWFPFRLVARGLLAARPEASAEHEIALVQPALVKRAQDDPRIEIRTYDMFHPWNGDRPDLIKVANVLNRSYFSVAELADAIRIQYGNLNHDGRLLIVDNRGDVESFSVFRKASDGPHLEYEHAGGADAAKYVAAAVNVKSDCGAQMFCRETTI